MTNILDRIEETIQDQIKYGPSESAMIRILKMIEDEKKFTGHIPTESFDSYVFQKVNSHADILRIAAKYKMSTEEVMAAYNRGGNGSPLTSHG